MKYLLTLIPVLCLLALFSCSGELPPPGIYLDNLSGNDNNKGDYRHPLKSIQRLNEILKEKSSDIYLAGGQTFDGTIILSGKSGTSSDTIKISSRGIGRATINGGLREAIKIDSCSYVAVRNVDLSGIGRKEGNKTNGLSFVNSGHCLAENINSSGFQISGVDLYNCRDMLVRNVYAYENGFSGINVMGSQKELSKNILIRDSRAENNPGDPAILDNHSGNGILVSISDSVIIDHCTATNNGWDMPRIGNGPVGIWAWGSDHITIQYCISYRNKTSKGAKDGGGFDFDGGMTNSVIQYCLSYENQGAGYGLFQFGGASDWYDNIIRYCVSINDGIATEGSGGFFIWNGNEDSRQLRGCYIYNNLVYSTYVPVISYEGSSNHEDFVFTNNIFIGRQLIGGENKGSKFQGNVWQTIGGPFKIMNFSSLEAWARATGQEMLDGKIVGFNEDPLLNGPFVTDITDPYRLNTLTGFTLKESSQVRDKGLPVVSKYGVEPPAADFFGNPVPRGGTPEPGISELQD